jgi:hypothetical protein
MQLWSELHAVELEYCWQPATQVPVMLFHMQLTSLLQLEGWV